MGTWSLLLLFIALLLNCNCNYLDIDNVHYYDEHNNYNDNNQDTIELNKLSNSNEMEMDLSSGTLIGMWSIVLLISLGELLVVNMYYNDSIKFSYIGHMNKCKKGICCKLNTKKNTNQEMEFEYDFTESDETEDDETDYEEEEYIESNTSDETDDTLSDLL